MSLGAAFNNASSGLTVALRAVGATSSNLANALTENYGKREVTIMSRTEGGARVTGTSRLVDQRTQGQIWLVNAQAAGNAQSLRSLEEIDQLVGTFDDPGSLYDLASKFETSLISLASRPEDTVRQSNANQAADDLADKIRTVGTGIQNIRSDADREISGAISALNADLEKIAELNGSIAKSHGQNTAALEDARQALIDKVSQIVPVKAVARDYGRIALMTPKGQFLLDQSASAIGFNPRNVVTSDMSVEGETLDLPILNGSAFQIPASGKLASLLQIRDTVAPEIYSQITALSETLVSRLSGVASEGPLFGFDTPSPHAVALGYSGDVSAIDANAALTALNTGNRRFSALVSDLSTSLSTQVLNAEDRLGSARSSSAALIELKDSTAVDTDSELQKLIRIEKIYAANAKALQVVGNMLDDLIKIG